MIDFNYSLIKGPYVSKRTGTVVKWYRNNTVRNITAKEVTVGPHAKNAKMTKSCLFFKNNQPKELVIRDLSLGANSERFFTKVEKGWKQIWSTLKPL